MLSSDHLDANQLGALLGGGLSARERSRILDHLGRCGRCRECAVLAQQAMREIGGPQPLLLGRMDWNVDRGEAVHASLPAGIRAARSWQGWRGWTVAAAAAVVIAGGVWSLQPSIVLAPARTDSAAAAPAARDQAPAAVAARETGSEHRQARPAPEPPTLDPALSASRTASAAVAAPPARPAAAPPASSVFVLPSSPARIVQSAQVHLPPPAPRPSPSGVFAAPMDFTPLTTGFQAQPIMPMASSHTARWTNASTMTRMPSSTPSGSTGSNGGNGNAPASTAASAQAPVLGPGMGISPLAALAEGFGPGLPLRMSSLSGPYAPAAPSGLGWAISRDGEVLRSVGAGLWATVPLLPGVHVHALFAAGRTVWAGANASQLFVSTDRGAHWRHVALPVSGSHPPAIASILFSSPRDGTVTLDNGRALQTTDGGQTWTAQP